MIDKDVPRTFAKLGFWTQLSNENELYNVLKAVVANNEEMGYC